jgi:N-acetyl-gamma-glutamyl-phosphate reductase
VAAVAGLRAALGRDFERLALVDLAADFRLRDPELYRSAYGHAHGASEELPGFAYGLPEMNRAAIQKSRRAAAPGCFATALQLAAWPAAKAGLLDARAPWQFFGVTGSSGSGAEPKPGTHHPHRHGNLWAYSLEGHRHEAELVQCLRALGQDPPLVFLPHSGPFARGIHLTAVLPLGRALSSAEASAVYQEALRGEPFVEVLSGRVPDLRSVAASNRAALGVHVRGSSLVVLAALDNVVKGGAGQALQCLNLILGFPETWGLPRVGLGVC